MAGTFICFAGHSFKGVGLVVTKLKPGRVRIWSRSSENIKHQLDDDNIRWIQYRLFCRNNEWIY